LLAVPVTEQETFISKSLQKTLKDNVKKSLTTLQEEQKVVEQAIKQLIEADPRLKELFDLMVSVPGIGPVIATELLITTNEMQTINDPKKLAASAVRLSRWGGSLRVSLRNKCAWQNQSESPSSQTAESVDPHGHHVSHPGQAGPP
jgi:adenylyl- and sulfurtransferase ThiI